jgi:hypothetical protein
MSQDAPEKDEEVFDEDLMDQDLEDQLEDLLNAGN